MKLADMFAAPEAGIPHLVPRAPVSEPRIRWWIHRASIVVAQQSNGVAFDDTAQAVRRGLVRHFDPQNGHSADHLADPAFQIVLASTHGARCRLSAVPALNRERRDSLGDCRSDQRTKDGASMVPAAVLHDATMLSQPSPERCLRAALERVGPGAHHTWATAVIGARLAVFKEEIDAPIRPVHAPVATRKPSTTISLILESVEEIVELLQVGEPFRHEPVVPRSHVLGWPITPPSYRDPFRDPQRSIASEFEGESALQDSPRRRVHFSKCDRTGSRWIIATRST